MKIKKQLYLLAILLSANYSMAQNIELGSWNVLNVKYNFNEKWSAFGESQLRSLQFYTDFHYYEIKGGTNFKFQKNLLFTLALGSYQTYQEGGTFKVPKNNNEFRVWPQITLTQKLGNFQIEQRYRTELRYTSNGYKNRFRYRMGISYPFGTDKNGLQRYQISASNELFFTNTEPYFERNRIVIALNYKTSKAASIQIGYISQFDYKINDETGRDFLQIGYFLEFNKTKKQNMPQ